MGTHITHSTMATKNVSYDELDKAMVQESASLAERVRDEINNTKYTWVIPAINNEKLHTTTN